jgi:hypothetical protein
MTAYNADYFPPIPVLSIRLAYPGEAPATDELPAIVDTGSDASLLPVAYLEALKALKG